MPAGSGTEAEPGPAVNVEANAVSDDGRVIVGGQGIGADDVDAVIWIDRVPHYLKDYLQANGVPDAFKTISERGRSPTCRQTGASSSARGAAPGGFRGYIVIFGEKP